jgi:hypothetical protein
VAARHLPWFLAVLALASCGDKKALPPAIGDPSPDGGHVVDASRGPRTDGCADDAAAPSPDAQGLCGNTFLDVTSDPPNLYFVIDRSGSMADILEGRQKYDAVATAAVALVRSLGSQANVGAAVFPGRAVDEAHPCVPGHEVYPTSPGDPIRSAICGNDGPVTRAFSLAISLPSGVMPGGSTPTAATLAALRPALGALRGRTFVLLATDGGPNCNSQTSCNADKCIPNIEKALGCSAGVNCCDPGLYGPTSCIDDEGTKNAVLDLFLAGIKTYVVGIPGSGPYASLLDDLAVAGGTARAGADHLYYDVQHIAELDDVLGSIGAKVTLSCQIHLAAPPPDSGLVNVYLDGQLVKYGPNGWVWGPSVSDAGPADADDASADADATDMTDAPDEPAAEAAVSHTEIDLVGTACAMLNSGKYRRLQVVFGCPTDIPR